MGTHRSDFTINCPDEYQLQAYKWNDDTQKNRGVIQIIHGMAEHARRYDQFASRLNGAGYTVYAHDQRGHGKTAAETGDIGFIAPDDGWQKLLTDIELFMDQIIAEYPEKPLYLFGHSMGSLLARNIMGIRGEQLTGVILSGTMRHPGFKLTIARILARLISALKGQRHRSQILHDLTFGSYELQNEYDWLSRVEEEVNRYRNDPCCGSVFTAEFYCNLFSGLVEVSSKEILNKVPEELPVFIISGAEDPVGEMGKGVMEVFQQYLEQGLFDIKYKLYPGARHELLHEINQEEVIGDIINWLKKRDDGNGKL